MKMKRLFSSAVLVMSAGMAVAGGLLTNTNQNVAFNRMMSREASIGIDGVYSNPAGVTFMAPGPHLSLNWQMATQTRTIKNTYPLFMNNENNKSTERRFQGDAYAPVIPSIQYAYNWDKYSIQANFAMTGGGGKCEFDEGLGSFERLVANTAAGACNLAGTIDGVTGMPMFSSDAMFGNTGKYSFDSYMRGRQYYFGLSLGMGYKVNDNLAVFAGVRGVYASCNYYGYVKNIKVGSLPLYQVLDPSKEDAADIELNCDQTGIGFTPIIGIDYKTGRWNFSAKYEFKTRMRLKNEAVNRQPSIGNLGNNLKGAFIQHGLSEQQADAILGHPKVVDATTGLKTLFDESLEEAIGEYTDKKRIAQDIPALLTLGAGYSPIDQVRINAGFHYFFDCQATSYNGRQKLLDRGTIEWNAGLEVDLSKKITASCGWQNTSYGLTDEYMDDKSFVTSSNSYAVGLLFHASKKIDVNLAYFTTIYGHEKTSETDAVTQQPYTADYTRTNNVFALGVDFNF